MQSKYYDSLPQWGQHTQRAVTYAWCKDLFSRKRGQYRGIGSSKYIRYEPSNDTYQIWAGTPHEADAIGSRWSVPVAAVHSDDSVEVLALGDQTSHMLLEGITGLMFFCKKDVRSTAYTWLRNYRENESAPVPTTTGMRIKAGVVTFNPTPPISRRIVNHKTAAPIRKMLAEWKERFRIVYMLRASEYAKLTWSDRHAAKRAVCNVSNTFDAEMAHNILLKAAGSTQGTEWDYETRAYVPLPDYEARLIKRAIEIIRDPVYELHGAFEWKEAA